MHEILNLYKPKGWTPLMAIDAIKAKELQYRDVKMTYAGRLDPMAEGVLPVLAGEAVHEKEAYMSLDKQYKAQILLGISTDSYDTLGLISNIDQKIPKNGLMELMRTFDGMNLLDVPPYSSTVVNGKPLFYWARNDQLSGIKIPKKNMIVHELTVKDIHEISAPEVLATVFKNVDLVKGDFRQKAIKASWDNHIESITSDFTIIEVDFHVASGTYIRSIAHEFGKKAGCGAILYSLQRTDVGKLSIDDSISL